MGRGISGTGDCATQPTGRLRRAPFELARSGSEAQRLREALRSISTRSANDPRRLEPLQELCAEAIRERRGGPECAIELPIRGAYGTSIWDVASVRTDEPLLLISAKAITSSRRNNVANRMTEMVGEAAGLRAAHPDATLGFICLLAANAPERLAGGPSRHTLARTAEQVGRRCQPEGPLHLFDADCVLRVNFERATFRALAAPGLLPFAAFLDQLVVLQAER